MEQPLTPSTSTAPIASSPSRASLMRQVASTLFTLVVLVLIGGFFSVNAQTEAHADHAGIDKELLAEMSGAVKLVKAQPGANVKRFNIAPNMSGTFEAFTLEIPIEGSDGSLRETIFVQDTRGRKIYEVQGFDFPRPFSALAWTSDRVLVFDQMMQPAHGAHYGIDVQAKRLIAARVFSDPPQGRANRSSATTEMPPGKIVSDFYKWYIATLNAGKNPMDNKRAMQKYVTAQTVRQLTKDYAAGEIDADPFLDLQDFDDTWAQDGSIKVAVPKINGATATTRVTFTGQNWTEPYSLNVTLKREGGAWKIAVANAAQSR